MEGWVNGIRSLEDEGGFGSRGDTRWLKKIPEMVLGEVSELAPYWGCGTKSDRRSGKVGSRNGKGEVREMVIP